MVSDNSAPPPEPQLGLLPSLVMFAAKASIIAFLCTASIIAVGAALNSAIDSKLALLNSVTKIRTSQIADRLERELARLADPKNGLSPKEQQEFLAQLRAAKANWKPFFSEAYSVLSDESDAQRKPIPAGDQPQKIEH